MKCKKETWKTWNSAKFKNGENFWKKDIKNRANKSKLKVKKCHFLRLFFGGSAHMLWKPLSNYLVGELCHSALLISPGRLLCFSQKKPPRCFFSSMFVVARCFFKVKNKVLNKQIQDETTYKNKTDTTSFNKRCGQKLWTHASQATLVEGKFYEAWMKRKETKCLKCLCKFVSITRSRPVGRSFHSSCFR